MDDMTSAPVQRRSRNWHVLHVIVPGSCHEISTSPSTHWHHLVKTTFIAFPLIRSVDFIANTVLYKRKLRDDGHFVSLVAHISTVRVEFSARRFVDLLLETQGLLTIKVVAQRTPFYTRFRVQRSCLVCVLHTGTVSSIQGFGRM